MQRYTLGLMLGLTVLASACDSSSSSSKQPTPTSTPTPLPTVSASRGDYLVNIGNGVSGLTADFRTATENLEAGAKAYCANRDGATLEALKKQYTETLLIWEKLEMFQIGPLAENNKALKTKIYGWPLLANYCKIDEESMYAAEDGPDYELTPYANRKGLQALEYLIFDDSLQSVCPANQIKADWDKLDTDQKWNARCAYMLPVAHELWENAGTVVTKWGGIDNNAITSRLGDPAAEQALLQEVFDNLFYLDLEVKNQKLAAPAGQDIKYCNKTPNPCPDKEELPFSHLSKAALGANFRALETIIFGFGQPKNGGMSALVRQEGGTTVADHSESTVNALVNSSEKQSASLTELALAKGAEDCEVSQVSWLCQVRTSIRSIIADFKGEYATLLKTTVPVAPQGDND